RQSSWRTLQGSHRLLAGAIAAGLLVALGGYALRSPPAPRYTNIPFGLASEGRALMVLNPRPLEPIEDRNGTGEPTRLTLPRALSDSDKLTLCSGAVGLEHGPSHLERSYLLALPPGHGLDARIDAKAYFPNSLNVLEIDREGVITGSTMSFSNR